MDVRAVAEVLAQNRQLRSVAVPDAEPCEGRDHTESVTARIAASGLLESVSVVDRWTRGLEPAALGDAIREAVGAAFSRRYGFDAPARGALQQDWSSALDGFTLTPPSVHQGDLEQAGTMIADAAESLRHAADRLTVEEATEALDKGLDALRSARQRELPATTTTVVGSPAQIQLTFFGPGLLTGCVVNAHWAHALSGSTLTMRINELLDEHRTNKEASRG